MRIARCTAILACLVVAGLSAQDQPDFSGRWMLESRSASSTEVPRALTVRQVIARTNVYGEPMKPYFKELIVEREFDHGTDAETYQIGVMGGTVEGLGPDRRSSGPRTHFSVTWDGPALVMDRGSYTGLTPESGLWTERRERWSLDPGGRLRVVITTRDAIDSKTVTLAYRQQ